MPFFDIDKPSVPVIEDKEMHVSGCDVKLKWSTPEDNGCPLTMYTIYQRNLEEEIWHQTNVTVDITSFHFPLQKCDTKYTYMFAVSAWNELGESELSSQLPIQINTGTMSAIKS